MSTLEYLELPLDEDDCRYHASFPVDQVTSPDARAFWERYGVLIARDVLTEEETQATIQDMDDLLASHMAGLSSFGMPKGVNALFRPALMELRQHPSVVAALQAVLGTSQIIVSHDRWLLHQPIADASQPMSRRNLHLDMNPWYYYDDNSKSLYERLDNLQYGASDRAFVAENNDVHKSMGTCVQAIVNLSDLVDATQGGTIVVPGSHDALESYLFGGTGDNLGGGGGGGGGRADESQRRVGPMQYKFDENEHGIPTAQHVRMRPGSLLVWDQRVVHGSTPNRSRTTARRAVPVRAFDASVLSKRRARERGRALLEQIQRQQFEDLVTETGRRVFGLDLL